MTPKIKTEDDLSAVSELHQAALKRGSDHFKEDDRNIADHLKGKSVEEIKAHLKNTGYPFAVCFEHWINDFNIATGIRNANGFNAKEVFYIGNKKWDRRGAVGVHNYTEVQWIPTVDDFVKLKEKYVIVGIDNVPGSVSISSYHFVPNTLFVFGEEGVGITPGIQKLCKDIVAIEQFGSVRSLNCGTVSGIIMYEFVKQFRSGQVL